MIIMYCPNCGKQTIESRETCPQERYYGGENAALNKNHCKECLASFENYDNGSEKRRKRDKEQKEKYETYLELKKEFEGKDKEHPITHF